MLKFRLAFVLLVVSLITALVMFTNHVSVGLFMGTIILLWIVIIFLGSMSMGWQFFLTAKTKHPKSKKAFFAITFDDGPNPEFTPQILDILKKHNAKATFFLIGKEAEKYSGLVKRIIACGHEIGNHSYSHNPYIGSFSAKKWLAEIEKTNSVLKQHAYNMVYFRPPFGITTPHLAKAIQHTNLKVIGWNKRSFDTFFKSESRILKRITKDLKQGDIILLHDKQPNCLPVLERLLQIAKQKQLQPVTISQLINEN